MTFARGLAERSCAKTRMVMVREIRNLGQPRLRCKASLTGHLVLSTLHTNAQSGAMTRLRDMGVEPFLLSSSLIGVLANSSWCVNSARTVNRPIRQSRRLCGVEREVLPRRPPMRRPVCEHCNQSGYRGRTGIF